MIEVYVQKRLGAFYLACEIKDENFICLLGKNGSGKSTLLNIIAGIIQPDLGQVKINSQNVTNMSLEQKQVVLVTPDSHLPHMDVGRHLLWGAQLRGKAVDPQTLEGVKRTLGINFRGKATKLSLGMRERLSLATALLATPRVILVDEAFGNIDNKIEFIRSYRELASNSRIDVLYSTQHKEDSEVADHLYQMEEGKAIRVR